MGRIVFGTSGWRGILCEDFIFENVKIVTQAIADHVIARGERDKGLIVGYDTRFLSDRYANDVARVLAANGFTVYLAQADANAMLGNLEAAFAHAARRREARALHARWQHPGSESCR